MGSKEQKYLIENRFDDVCLNRSKVDYHGDSRGYLYVSDVMEKYIKAAQKNEESPETIDNTSSPKCSRYFECNNELKHTSSSKCRPSCLIN